jgi:L-ascorbate metabolism protein UlaG (beta-lactamase superfamily)
MTMLTGNALIEDIDRTASADGELALWWLGQHSFVIKLAGEVVYLDPFLSDVSGRTVPPMVAPEQVTHAAVVTGTHDHGDHIDRKVWPAIAAASEATFIVPELILQQGLADDLDLPPDRFAGLDDGQSVTVGPLTITALPAAHELLDVDEATGLHPYLGFVIEGGGCRVYHAGDTCKWEGLEGRLKQLGPIDVALLPINGRDAERLKGGCIGNMTYQEAVDLAGAVRPCVTIPTHYEMFTHNSEDPACFVDYMNVKFPDLTPLVVPHGRRVRIGADGPTIDA